MFLLERSCGGVATAQFVAINEYYVLLKNFRFFLDGDLAVLLRWKKLICLVALLVGAVAPQLAAEVKLSTAFF